MPIPMDPAILPGPNSTASYPASTKSATGQIDGVLTDVMTTLFADKIMVTIIQGGRLAQWVIAHILWNVYTQASKTDTPCRFTYHSNP